MVNGKKLVTTQNGERKLTAKEFQSLADVPPELEWFANIENANTRRAYRNDVSEFTRFAGIERPDEFREVKRSHLIAWRKQLEGRALEPSTIRRKLSAIASLFDHLCEANAVSYNPADGVRRPSEGMNEGKSPALGDDQAKAILEAPAKDTLKGLRDRAILSTLLYHGLRRSELCSLKVGDIESRRGVPHFRVLGKGGKIRYIPIHPQTIQRIGAYLQMRVRSKESDSQGLTREETEFAPADFGNQNADLFSPVKNSRTGTLDRPLTGHAIYKDVVQKYARQLGIAPRAICVHGLRATAATNAMDHECDIAKVQEWLGHSNISTTRLYDRRKTKPEESPTFKVSY